MNLTTPEPAPQHNDLPAVWELVIADMRERHAFGLAKYGTPLQMFNGRDPKKDRYQELLDAICYTRQDMAERDYVNGQLAQLRVNLLEWETLNRAQIEQAASVIAEILTMNHWKGEA